MSNKKKQTQHKPRFDYKQAQMNAEKKKKRRNQIYAYILLFFFVLWTVGTALSFFNFFGGKNSMSAIAEEGAPVASVSETSGSGFDLSQYPAVNLIAYPYYSDTFGRTFYVGDTYNLRGVDFSFNADGSISVVGTSSENFTFVFMSGCSLPVDCSYAINGGKNGVVINCWKRGSDGVVVGFASSSRGSVGAGRIESGESFYRVGLTLQNGFVYDTTIYPMLNVGQGAYPYMPPFDLIYNQGYKQGSLEGYDNGYNVGYADGESVGREEGYPSGYQDGYDEGLAFSKHGIFQHLNFEVKMFSSAGYEIWRTSGLLGPNSVSFGNVYEELISSYRYDYYFELSIVAGHGYENEIPMSLINGAVIGTGDALALYGKDNSFTVCGSNYFVDAFYQYTGYFEKINIEDGLSSMALPYYMLKFEQGSSDPDISNIGFGFMTLRFDDIDVFKKLSFAYTDGYYNQGYNTGYNFGYSQGLHDGHSPAYNQGYAVGKTEGEKIGFDNGKIEGKQEGLREGEAIGYTKGVEASENYSFLALITAVVDVPIQAFTSLFNFEVLGVNLKNFFFGLFTLAVVLCVVKLILAK